MKNKKVNKKQRSFCRLIWNYYRRHRRSMPWRETVDPYYIVVSEIMLQQTQVGRVIPKYEIFIKTFPSFAALARAPQRRVLAAWQGLGYNRRALALHTLARTVCKIHNGRLPTTREELERLPGIGPGTSGSILAFAFDQPVSFIETNIRRVYIHTFFPTQTTVADSAILPLVESTVDKKHPREWYYALMDYGAMLKNSVKNPNRRSQNYRRQKPFAGSDRQLRGNIIKFLLHNKSVKTSSLYQKLGSQQPRVRGIMNALEKEGFIKKHKNTILLV